VTETRLMWHRTVCPHLHQLSKIHYDEFKHRTEKLFSLSKHIFPAASEFVWLIPVEDPLCSLSSKHSNREKFSTSVKINALLECFLLYLTNICKIQKERYITEKQNALREMMFTSSSRSCGKTTSCHICCRWSTVSS